MAIQFDSVEIDGVKNLRLVSDAICWKDSMTSPYGARTAAANLSLQSFIGGIYVPRIDKNDEIFGSVQFNHDLYCKRADVVIYPHMHICNKNAIGAVNYNIGIEFEWAWGDVGADALKTATNVGQVDYSIANSVAYVHHLLSFDSITGGTDQDDISSVFVFRLKRVSAVADAYDTNDIFYLGFDIHYQVNSLGSEDYSSKL